MMINNLDIYIAAGGKSSRMGQDKGLLKINGKPMIVYIADMLQEAGLGFTVIANADEYLHLGYRVIKDVVKEKGPMGALYTAFCHTNKQYVLLLGCDTPFFPYPALKRLIENTGKNQVTVIQNHSEINPLHCSYAITLKEKVKSCIEHNKLKMQDMILQSEYQLINIDDIAVQFPNGFINMNEPQDLKQCVLI